MTARNRIYVILVTCLEPFYMIGERSDSTRFMLCVAHNERFSVGIIGYGNRFLNRLNVLKQNESRLRAAKGKNNKKKKVETCKNVTKNGGKEKTSNRKKKNN